MTTTETPSTAAGEANAVAPPAGTDTAGMKPAGMTPIDMKPGGWAKTLSFRNISAIYTFISIFVIFSLVTPQTFLQAGVWRTLLDAQAITVIAAIAVLIPLVTGAFNLA